ncbi:MAG: ChbG/HpnK family deacetylase [Candidatus Marinimicrobia bacterium]|nr:ChbG/HpnK family deacetylase [Candidatus Neomarinimicrobiota bacterium]
MARRFLIVNADDFGRSSDANKAILKSISEGIVKSVTVMVNTSHAYEICNIKKLLPNPSIGLHVNLTEGKPISHPDVVPSLVNYNGEFLGFKGFIRNLVSGRIKRADLRIEIETQMDRLFDIIGTVDHIDSHKHIHIYPSVLKSMLSAGKKRGISRIRTNCRYFIASKGVQYPQLLMEFKHYRKNPLSIFGRIIKSFQYKLIKSYNFRSPNYLLTPLPIIKSTSIDNYFIDSFQYVFKYLPYGISELNFHPGNVKEEMELLTSNEIRDTLNRNQIQLTSYLNI